MDANDEFGAKLDRARRLLDQDGITAVHVGVIRDGEEVDSTVAQRATDSADEGLQALSLLAAHLRLVSDEAGVDSATVARDAATVAERVEESGDAEIGRDSDDG